MSPADFSTLGERIKQRRRELELSQEALAERASLSPPHISRIECGQKVPRLESLVSIAEALEISPDELIYDVPVPRAELKDLLADCSESDKRVILKTAQALKTALKKRG